MSIQQREFSTPNDGQQYHVCPCCGKTLAIAGIQQSFVAGRPDSVIVICETTDCGMYLKSCTEREITKNWQTWGSPSMNGGVA